MCIKVAGCSAKFSITGDIFKHVQPSGRRCLGDGIEIRRIRGSGTGGGGRYGNVGVMPFTGQPRTHLDGCGRDAETLGSAANALGGRPVPTDSCDLAFDFQIFPRVTLRLVWHAPDEEFPSSATYRTRSDRTCRAVELKLVVVAVTDSNRVVTTVILL